MVVGFQQSVLIGIVVYHSFDLEEERREANEWREETEVRKISLVLA